MNIDIIKLNNKNFLDIDEDITIPEEYLKGTQVRGTKDIHVNGRISIDSYEDVQVNLEVNGIFVLGCAITLDDVDDISTVKISKKTNEYEKILDFIENTKNPYIFKCNGKFVKIEFINSNNLTASERLINTVSSVYK